MLSRNFFEKVTLIDLLLLIVSLSFSLFGDEMQKYTSQNNNYAITIGLFYNCTSTNSNQTIFHNSANSSENTCTTLDLNSMNYSSYKGNTSSDLINFFALSSCII